jgi:hypothetical protein
MFHIVMIGVGNDHASESTFNSIVNYSEDGVLHTAIPVS